jgi:hypothetical protein
MGLGTEERKFLRAQFGGAFSFNLPSNGVERPHPGVVIVDFMQWVKSMPKEIHTRDGCITYLTNFVKRLMFQIPGVHTVIVCVDGKPTPVKRMVEHGGRYKDKNVYRAIPGMAYFPKEGTDLIPTEWIRFAGNYKLLRRELYPALFNAFMQMTPKPGQMLILSGFPGQSRPVPVRGGGGGGNWEAHVNHKAGTALEVHLWEAQELPITKEMEKADPDLYHRTYLLENVMPCAEYPQGAMRRAEWVEAKNDISEGDIRMFWFEHWYQNEPHILFSINDGDVFSIALLYAYERLRSIQREPPIIDGKQVLPPQANVVKYTFRNNHTIMLPYKQVEGNSFFAADQVPKYEYVDVNKFYELVREYTPLHATVQNPVATLVFLLIISGSDFFPTLIKGIGAQTVVWKVFFDNIAIFSHMVQLSEGVPQGTRTPRDVVIDEDLFIIFTRYCMIEKHEGALLKKMPKPKGKKKKGKDEVSSSTIVAASAATATAAISFTALQHKMSHDAKGLPKADTAYHMPTKNAIRLRKRQCEWNFKYWKNGPLGHVPDPFEMWNGIPYYPYMLDARNKPYLCDVVAPWAKPVDMTMDQHLYRTRVLGKKRPRNYAAADEQMEQAQETAKRQQRVVDAFGHRVKE